MPILSVTTKPAAIMNEKMRILGVVARVEQ
jgi:hypothetical protein